MHLTLELNKFSTLFDQCHITALFFSDYLHSFVIILLYEQLYVCIVEFT